MSYSIDFRKRTIEYLEEGHTYKETAKTFKITESTLSSWLKRYRINGNLTRKYREYKTKINPSELEKHIAEYPDDYQTEMAKQFCCSQPTIFRMLKRLGISRKKKQLDIKNKTLKK